MKSNPICIQILWNKNPEALAKWANVSVSTKTKIVVKKKHSKLLFLTSGSNWISVD